MKLSPIEKLNKSLFIGDINLLIKNDYELLNKFHKNKNFAEVVLIVGGPPCQGFSMAGKRDKNDKRNELPLSFLSFVSFYNPKFVIMENVGGMKHCFDGCELSPLDEIKDLLEKNINGTHKYIVQKIELNSKFYNVAQNRKRIFLFAVREDIFKENNIKIFSKNKLLDTDFYIKNDITCDLFPEPVILEDFYTVKEAIFDLEKAFDSKYVHFINHLFKDTLKVNNDFILNNHHKRKHTFIVENRFRLYQVFNKKGVSKKIFNIASKYKLDNNSDIKKEILKELSKIDYPLYSFDNHLMAHNIEELFNLVINFSTKKHSQTVLNENKPSPTVVSSPDDIIHPFQPRGMTVREQARFQSFPDYFVFKSKETTGGELRKIEVQQYTQVANAVPPVLAFYIGKKIFYFLK